MVKQESESATLSSKPSFMVYLLAGYMWLFIHRPFEVWPWLGAYHAERVYVLTIIVFWFIFARKGWISCRNNLPVFLMLLTLGMGVLMSTYAGFDYVEDWVKIFLFYVLLITSVQREEDLRFLVFAFVFAVAVYELHSLTEFINGRHVYRMGTRRMVGV